MNTNSHELVHKDEVYEIVGCAMEVSNTLGHGLLEKCYENALVVEFNARNIPVSQQKVFQVGYKGEVIGTYIPDLLVFEKIIVDTKTIDSITDHQRGQILNYLRISDLRVGIILNFKKPKLEWERLVL